MYPNGHFENTRAAPKPPIQAPQPSTRNNLFPDTNPNMPGNMVGRSMQSPAFNNGSQMSLVRTQSERSVSTTATVKEGMVKVKDASWVKGLIG